MTNEIDTAALLSKALDENEQLREAIRQLQSQGAGQGPVEIDNNPLCKGCYRWRLAAAASTGIASALFMSSTVQDFWGLLQRAAFSMTGYEFAPGVVQGLFLVITALAPVSAVIAEWKWLLYKRGYPGALRAIAEIARALKGGWTGN
ncbi:MAG TPA: hypothetical protein VMB85_03075 [Bryobacteraceae bacterium]|nr:hypothetical protein [Bryobacteraceae bacterium]